MQEIAELRLQEEIALIALSLLLLPHFLRSLRCVLFSNIMSFEPKEHARTAFLEPGATKAQVALQVDTWIGPAFQEPTKFSFALVSCKFASVLSP